MGALVARHTPAPWLAQVFPAWLGPSLSVFSTVEMLAAQTVAVGLVGAHIALRSKTHRRAHREDQECGWSILEHLKDES